MKRKLLGTLLLFLLLQLYACGAYDDTDSNASNVAPSGAGEIADGSLESGEDGIASNGNGANDVETQDNDGNNVGEQELPGITSLPIHLDEAASIHNSNIFNFGYLAAAPNGKIYWSDYNDGVIYEAEPDGSDKKVFIEDTGNNLQATEEHLYYTSTNTSMIMRANFGDGSIETVWGESAGEFLLKDDSLYINAQEGFVKCSLDGAENRILFSDIMPVRLQEAGDLILFTQASEEDVSVYVKGNLYAYDCTSENDALRQIDRNILYHLPVGQYLYCYRGSDGNRHRVDVATNNDIRFKLDILNMAGENSELYVVYRGDDTYRVCSWNEDAAVLGEVGYNDLTLLLEVPVLGKSHPYIYIADSYLYLLELKADGSGSVVESVWYVYDLTNAVSGEL